MSDVLNGSVTDIQKTLQATSTPIVDLLRQMNQAQVPQMRSPEHVSTVASLLAPGSGIAFAKALRDSGRDQGRFGQIANGLIASSDAANAAAAERAKLDYFNATKQAEADALGQARELKFLQSQQPTFSSLAGILNADAKAKATVDAANIKAKADILAAEKAAKGKERKRAQDISVKTLVKPKRNRYGKLLNTSDVNNSRIATAAKTGNQSVSIFVKNKKGTSVSVTYPVTIARIMQNNNYNLQEALDFIALRMFTGELATAAIPVGDMFTNLGYTREEAIQAAQRFLHITQNGSVPKESSFLDTLKSLGPSGSTTNEPSITSADQLGLTFGGD